MTVSRLLHTPSSPEVGERMFQLTCLARISACPRRDGSHMFHCLESLAMTKAQQTQPLSLESKGVISSGTLLPLLCFPLQLSAVLAQLFTSALGTSKPLGIGAKVKEETVQSLSCRGTLAQRVTHHMLLPTTAWVCMCQVTYTHHICDYQLPIQLGSVIPSFR